MNLNVKPYLILIASMIILFILIGIVGNALAPQGMENLDKKYLGYVKFLVFAMFFVICLSLVPICLKSYLISQNKIGNGSLPLVRLLNENAMTAIFAMWGIFILGLITALPFMIKDGFFTE